MNRVVKRAAQVLGGVGVLVAVAFGTAELKSRARLGQKFEVHRIELPLPAANDQSAKVIALSIANSPLVKTAVAGNDANWGRIVMAVGKAGEPADRDRLKISFGNQVVAEKGERSAKYDEAAATKAVSGDEVEISVDLGIGKGSARVWTCDLTEGYIRINGSYRS